MKVICISGKAGHGKDTVANFMKTCLEDYGSKVLVTHNADLVKYICRTFFDWDGEKNEYGRAMLQHVGTDVVRKKDPDYWVRFLSNMLCFFNGEWDYVLIPDCRFKNEIEYLKEAGFNVSHVRVIRDNFKSNLTEEQLKHISETALDNYPADYYVENDGDIHSLQKAAEVLTLNLK